MTATPKEAPQAKNRRSMQSYIPIAILVVLVAIGLAATAAGSLPGRSGALSYGCITASTSGGAVDVTTTGIIHYTGSQYYIVCPEGAAEPTTPASVSCLSIAPKTVTTSYPSAQPAFWYYLSAPGGSIAIKGAPSNATILTQPNSAVVVVTCG